ncbi:MAG: UbiA family prenyltransferase [Patescibacteria group bacterium]|nr:UbiA family prenyltransferase [Patescibacteria group bacterium]
MLQKLQKIISSIEEYPLTIPQFLLGFSAIIAFRMLGENLLANFEGKSFDFFVDSTLAAYLFFLFSIIILILFLSAFLKESFRKTANVLLGGFFIVIFPPIFDKILCGTQQCWSFYAFDSLRGIISRFFTFFGDNPAVGITYGVRIEVALAVLFLIFYIFLKTKNALKAFLGGLISYTILFILGSFPSWLTFLFLAPSKSITSVEGFDVAGIFLSPVHFFSLSGGDIMNALNVKMNLIYAFLLVPLVILFFWVRPVKSPTQGQGAEKPQFNRVNFREKFWAVAKNIRWIQILIHAGLILFGAGLGAFYFPENITVDVFSFFALANLILAAIFGWLASVFLNDIVDLEIDKITNEKRPTVTGKVSVNEYGQLFWASFAMSMILALTVGVKFFLVILAYQIIGWAYSCPPFRLKRFPGIATGLSAFALTLLFSSGFMLLANGRNVSALPSKVFWLLIVAFFVSLPMKDLKDIEGDRKSDIWTIPALLGETWARFVIGLGIFISYALSVVWLNVKILFLPAMILGAASFWILQSKKISARRVHIFVFGLLFLYVFLMAYLVFYPAFKVEP